MTDDNLYEKGSLHLHRFITSFALTLLVIGSATARVHADLTISLSDVTVAPGSMGTMDFTVSSNNSDTLSAFSLELLITPVGTPSSLLQFTSSQSDPYGNANYVFNSGSFGSDNGVPFWSGPQETYYPSDTITGGDMSDAFLGYVTLPTPPDSSGALSYLASVQFLAPEGAMQGDQFQVSLVSDPNFTYFDDQFGNPLMYSSAMAGGLVTVSSVPEPSSLALLAIPGACGGLLWCRRGRRSRTLIQRPAASEVRSTSPGASFHWSLESESRTRRSSLIFAEASSLST